jgi:hypothetical protein
MMVFRFARHQCIRACLLALPRNPHGFRPHATDSNFPLRQSVTAVRPHPMLFDQFKNAAVSLIHVKIPRASAVIRPLPGALHGPSFLPACVDTPDALSNVCVRHITNSCTNQFHQNSVCCIFGGHSAFTGVNSVGVSEYHIKPPEIASSAQPL